MEFFKMNKIRNFLYKLYKYIFKNKIISDHQKQKTELCSHEIRLLTLQKSLLESERYQNDLRLNKFGYKNFSQYEFNLASNSVFNKFLDDDGDIFCIPSKFENYTVDGFYAVKFIKND